MTSHGATAWEDKALRRELGHLSGELESLWAVVKLSVCEAKESGVPGVGASAVKLYYSELYQKITELGLRLLGRAGLSRSDVAGLPAQHLLNRHLNSLSISIEPYRLAVDEPRHDHVEAVGAKVDGGNAAARIDSRDRR